MAVIMKYTLSVLLLCYVLVNSELRTGLRWDVGEPGGRMMRTLTDGQEIISLEYNRQGELVQCWKTKQGKEADSISLLFYSAMSDSHALRKDAIDIDIKQLVKHCKNYTAKVESGKDNSALMSEMETITALRERIDGSKWCGLSPKRSKAKALNKEDRCCKQWHQCDLQIQPYNYEHMMFNYRPHSIIGCNCTSQLEACLRNLTASGLAEEVLELMFDVEIGYTPVCLALELKERCVEWDNFYHKCNKFEQTNYGVVRSWNEYKVENLSADHDSNKKKEEERQKEEL